MEENFNLNQLLQKPIAMMTGEELCFLITKSVEASEKPTIQTASKGNYYGIEGIARIFGCSVPTANRIKKSGIIDKLSSYLCDRQGYHTDRTKDCGGRRPCAVFGKGIRWNPY